jgi:hypothetical protein
VAKGDDRPGKGAVTYVDGRLLYQPEPQIVRFTGSSMGMMIENAGSSRWARRRTAAETA